MRRSFYEKLIIFVFIVLFNAFIIDEVKALEPKLTRCTMSDEYKAWLELSDEEKEEYIRPAYCDSNVDKTNITVSSVTSKIDTIFSNQVGSTLPSKYDLRETDYVPVLKNQGSTGGCWAFSTTTVLETIVKIKYKENYVFSTRHIEYALTRGFNNNQINEYGFNRAPGTGGDYHMAASYLVNGLGPVLEEDMPFEDNEDVIDISEIDKEAVFDVNDVVLKTGNIGTPCTSSQISEIKEYVYQNGAVAASIYMLLSDNYYNSTTGAYYYNGSKSTNHAITIIGWDDNYSKNNFSSKNRPSSNGAWIVQNSYGTNYSLNGYNYISYEDVHTCDQIMSVVDLDKDIDDNSYILDKLGYNQYFGYIYGDKGSTEAYAMNIFTKEKGKREVLKEITMGSSGTGSYTIYYMEGKANNRKTSEMLLLGSGKLEHSGYVTHKLDNPKILDDDVTDYSIVVYYKMDSSTMPIPVSGRDSNRYSPVSVASGVTFASPDGINWSDLSNFNGTLLIASIKAFTDDVDYSIDFGKPVVTVNQNYYEVNIEYTSYKVDINNISLVLTGSDGFVYTPKYSEINDNSIILKIDKSYSGERILNIKYGDDSVGKVRFYLNTPLTSDKYTIDEDKGYIYVPVKTSKSTFLSNVKTILEPNLINVTDYMYTGLVVENYIIIVKGDVNGDGVITPLDYVKIKNHIMGTDTITKEYLYLAADYNDDSIISPLDYVKVKNYIMNGE